MSLHHNPKVITNGLVFYYDMNNSQKSWRGKPTTNIRGGTALEVHGGNIPTINNSYNLRADDGSNGWSSIISTGSGSNHRIAQFPYNNHNSGIDITYSLELYNPGPDNLSIFIDGTNGYPHTNIPLGYSRWSYTLNRATFGSQAIFFGAAGNLTNQTYSPPRTIYYKNYQVEESSFATPYTESTRSSTQALLDLTNNNTITTSSLTYNTDGTFSFNGNNNNYIDGGNNTSVLNITNPTISVWVKRTAYNSSFPMIIRRNDRDAYSLQVGQSDDTIWFKIYQGSSTWTSTPTSTIPLNTWFHFCGIFTGSQLQLYKNGQLVQTANTTSPISYADASVPQLIIGRDDPVSGRYWHGDISNVQIYNRALSSTEIMQSFQALRGRFSV